MASTPPRSRNFLVFQGVLLLGIGLLLWWVLHLNVPRIMGLPPELEAAQAALKTGDVTKARSAFDKALQARPNDVTTYEMILDLCQANKQWNLMITYAQAALCVFKDAPLSTRAELNFLLSSAYQEAEPSRPQKFALYAMQSAWQLNPTDATIQNGYGYLLADNDQNLDDAMILIQQALKTARNTYDPSLKALLPAIEDSYGWVLYKKGRYKEAADTLLQALYDYPDGTTGDMLKVSYYHLGATYRQMEAFEESRQALQSALFYDPDYADAKAERAKLPPPATPSQSAQIESPNSR